MTCWELSRRARNVLPGGANSGARIVPGLEDIVIAAAEGATITDADGHTYVDYHAAYGPVILGHADADVLAAFVDAYRSVDIVGLGVTEVEVELAEKITSLVPCAEQVVLLSTGTEATFYAVRLARGVTGRRLLVKFQGCFHGSHDSVAMNVISRPERVGTRDPLSIGVLPEIIDATLVLPFNDIEAVRRTVAEYRDEIAAIILEPIPHNVGAILPEQEFLEGLREICSKEGIVLIFDEVITGFRHGPGGAQGRLGVTPDLTTMGKALGNGFPISVLCGRADIMDRLGPKGDVLFAGTFAGHTLNTAAALECTRIVLEGAIHAHLARLGRRLTSGIQAAIDETGARAQVLESAGVWTIYFTDRPIRRFRDFARFAMDKDHPVQRAYRNWLLARGIYVHPHYMIRGFLTGAHTEDDVDRVVDATAGFLRKHRDLLAAP